jgi:hypothetical protein
VLLCVGIANFMHVGSPGVSPSPEFTIDDLRVSQVSDFLNDPGFLPSRYPQPAQPATTPLGTFDYYGIHQVFLPDFNGQAPVFTNLTVRVNHPAPSNAVMPVAVVDTSTTPFRMEFQFPKADNSAPFFGRPIIDDVTLMYTRLPEFIEFFERYSPWDVDQDSDGIPDAVEDADQDQVVDPTETDPNDPDSVLALSAIATNGAGSLVVQFQCVTGKTYAVEFNDDVASGGWSTATGAVINTVAPGGCEWLDDGTLTGGLPAGERAYRVNLTP